MFSPQEIRILLSDKIQFAQTNNVLTNIIASRLNEILSSPDDNEKDLASVIDSGFKCSLNVNSIGFDDSMKTILNLRLGLDQQIVKSFKFANLDLFPLELIVRSKESSKELLNLSISVDGDYKHSYMALNLRFTRDLWLLGNMVTVTVKKDNKVFSMFDLQKKTLFSIIRSLFHQLHVKEKIENHSKVKVSNLTIDARNALFNFEKIIEIENLLVCFENCGFRDLVRCKITNILAVFFGIVPNKFNLEVNADNIDIFCLNIKPLKSSIVGIDKLATTIYNFECRQDFDMIYEKKSKGNEYVEVNSNDKPAVLECENSLNEGNGQDDGETKGKLENSITSKLSHRHASICPYDLLFGRSDEYAIVFKANVRCNLKNKERLLVCFLEPRLLFCDSIFDFVKDDTITVPVDHTPGVFLESSFKGIAIALGINVNIAFPEGFEIVGISRDMVFIQEVFSFINNEDGHFRMRWSKLFEIKSFKGAIDAVLLV